MRRDALEMYLDNELDAQQKAAVEQALLADADARRTLERLQAERMLRQRALAGYTPPPAEAAAFGARMIAGMRAAETAPLAKIGPHLWAKRLTSVAAALLLASGTYWMGMQQAAPVTPAVSEGQHTTMVANGNTGTNNAGTNAVASATHYIVYVPSSSGVLTKKEFTSDAEAQAYAYQVQQDLAQNTQLAVASNDGYGAF